jgi:hypothetical protein
MLDPLARLDVDELLLRLMSQEVVQVLQRAARRGGLSP